MAHGSDLKFLGNNVVSITHEQNISWRKTRLDGTTYEQTIIVGS